jgi:chorismate--pyruvate lyase
MFLPTPWGDSPPSPSAPLCDWLCDQGSLTDRLIHTGHVFSVTVLTQGTDSTAEDEAQLIRTAPGSPLYARHVVLSLDSTPVVVARSITLAHCSCWRPILERGSRSLGLTLFDPNSPIIREAMLYCVIDPRHPLFTLAAAHDPSSAAHYPARRSNFALEGTVMNVCEIFLPALEHFL